MGEVRGLVWGVLGLGIAIFVRLSNLLARVTCPEFFNCVGGVKFLTRYAPKNFLPGLTNFCIMNSKNKVPPSTTTRKQSSLLARTENTTA